MSVPGHRLRRDALRILAQKLEGTTLSSTGADNLLAKHATLADSLRAVRRERIRRRHSGRFGGIGVLSTEIGILQLPWIARAVAAFQLCLVALFLQRIGSGIGVGAEVQLIEAVFYVIASSFALLALACCWRATRR